MMNLVEVYFDRLASEAVAFFSRLPATWDIVIVLLAFGLFFLVGVAFGARRLYYLILATYIAFAIFTVFPFFDKVLGRSNLENPLLFLFLGLVAAIFFVLAYGKGKGISRSWTRIGVLAALEVGLLATLMFKILPPSFLKDATALVRKAFAIDLAVFAWIIAPMVVFFFWREE